MPSPCTARSAHASSPTPSVTLAAHWVAVGSLGGFALAIAGYLPASLPTTGAARQALTVTALVAAGTTPVIRAAQHRQEAPNA